MPYGSTEWKLQEIRFKVIQMQDHIDYPFDRSAFVLDDSDGDLSESACSRNGASYVEACISPSGCRYGITHWVKTKGVRWPLESDSDSD